MQHNSTVLIILLMYFPFYKLFAQYTFEETKSNPCFVGSSAFMLTNLAPNETPEFFQANFGYRITKKDVLSLELKTWKYYEPIGIPYGKQKSDPEENFPGYIKEKGFAIAYQRFIWKRFYEAIRMNDDWDADSTSSTTSAKSGVFKDGVNSISINPEVDNARLATPNCKNFYYYKKLGNSIK